MFTGMWPTAKIFTVMWPTAKIFGAEWLTAKGQRLEAEGPTANDSSSSLERHLC